MACDQMIEKRNTKILSNLLFDKFRDAWRNVGVTTEFTVLAMQIWQAVGISVLGSAT